MKKNTHSETRRNHMETLERFLTCMIVCIVAFAAVAALLCINAYKKNPSSTLNPEINYEENFFNYASREYVHHEYSFGPEFNLLNVIPYKNEDGVNLFRIEFANHPAQHFRLINHNGNDAAYESAAEQTTFKKFSKRHEKMIESARNFVIEFVNDSSFFKDKEFLIERIRNVPIYLYSESANELLDTANAPAVHTGKAIYCDADFKNFFCEYMFVHELFHHLRYLTMGEKLSNVPDFASMFDEGVTDFLTVSMEPAMFTNNTYESGYAVFYPIIGKYFHVFGKEALEAYFYGYDDFYASKTSTFKIEHEFFVSALDGYIENYYCIVSTESMVNKWDAQYTV